MLVCPECDGELSDVREGERWIGLACLTHARLYPVVDGVPWLIPERALPWSPTSP